MISTAPDAKPGICTLTLARNTSTSRYIDIPAGYTFQTSEGIDLILQEPLTVTPGTSPQTVDLALVTRRTTELVNTYVPAFDTLLKPGALMLTGTAAVDIQDYTLAGTVKTYHNTVLGPHATDDQYALRYSASTTITNATSDWLGAHGNERGQRRQTGETTEDYRARIRLFPDAVSPVAIATAVHAAAENALLPEVFFVETIDAGASAAAIAQYSLATQDSVFADLTNDFLDDPIGQNLPAKYPWRTLELLSSREARAYFRLAMNGAMQEESGATLYYEYGYLDDPSWGYPEELLSLGQIAPKQLGALWTVALTARQLKAAGVQFDLYFENEVVIPTDGVATGESAAALATVWTITATAGSAWLVTEGLVSHTYWEPGQHFHQVKFTFSDSTTFTTPLTDRGDSEHMTFDYLATNGYPFKPVVQIDGIIASDGVSINLAGTFWAVAYTL
jgi:hypothetical protein